MSRTETHDHGEDRIEFGTGATSLNLIVNARMSVQAAAINQQIDHLAYDLYDLTEEEIAIVEGEVG